MARARLLKPGFFSNEELCEIVPFGRLLFAGLWTIADREGRMVDSPKWIKAQVFPFDNVPVEKLLSDLEKAGFIQRYGRPDGKRYIQVTKFSEHQHPHIKEVASTIPGPGSAPDEHVPSTGLSTYLDPEKDGLSPAVSKSVSDPVAVTSSSSSTAWLPLSTDN